MKRPATPLGDRAADVQRIAISGVTVADDGDIDGTDDVAGLRQHLGHSQQTDVGCTQDARRYARPGHDRGVEAALLDEPSREPVVYAGSDQGPLGLQQFPEAAALLVRLGHVRASFVCCCGSTRSPCTRR
jgi:hypothetical protein